MAKVSQRQIVAKIERAHGSVGSDVERQSNDDWSSERYPYFAQVSGGEIQATVERVYDGGATFPDVLPSPIEVGDLQCTRHFDPDRDGALMKKYRPQVGKARFDVTVFTLNDDLKVNGSERIYPNALLTGMTEPEGDSSSGAAATFTLTFACQSVADGTVNN